MNKINRKAFDNRTFEEDDRLELNAYADSLFQYLLIDRHFVLGSLVVSLEAPFGSGKSQFLTMWCNHLRRKSEDESAEKLIVLKINAWEDDFCGDPLLSLLEKFLELAERNDHPQSQTLKEKLVVAGKTIGWFGVGLANSIVKSLAGVDPVAAGDLAEKKTTERDASIPPLALEAFRYRRQALRELKTALEKYLIADETTVFIMIDELDRCRPDYAVSYLETIKHVFDVPGLVFILTIDRGHLENSARAQFGSNLNAQEYLRKFINRSFLLPQMSTLHIEKVVDSLTKELVKIANVRDSHFDNYMSGNAKELCLAFHMSLRQLNELFLTLGFIFTKEASESNQPNRPWMDIILLLSTIKVWDYGLYCKMGGGKVKFREFAELIFERMKTRQFTAWTALYYVAVVDPSKPQGNTIKNLSDTFVSKIDIPFFNSLVSNITGEWHANEGMLDRAFKVIETASPVIKPRD